MDNGIYQSTTTPGAARSDIVAVARGCDVANCAWTADGEDRDRLVAAALRATQPALIAARIDDAPGRGKTNRDPVRIRERFMRGIGVRAGP